MEAFRAGGLAITLVILDGMASSFDRHDDDVLVLNEGERFE